MYVSGATQIAVEPAVESDGAQAKLTKGAKAGEWTFRTKPGGSYTVTAGSE